MNSYQLKSLVLFALWGVLPAPTVFAGCLDSFPSPRSAIIATLVLQEFNELKALAVDTINATRNRLPEETQKTKLANFRSQLARITLQRRHSDVIARELLELLRNFLNHMSISDFDKHTDEMAESIIASIVGEVWRLEVKETPALINLAFVWRSTESLFTIEYLAYYIALYAPHNPKDAGFDFRNLRTPYAQIMRRLFETRSLVTQNEEDPVHIDIELRENNRHITVITQFMQRYGLDEITHTHPLLPIASALAVTSEKTAQSTAWDFDLLTSITKPGIKSTPRQRQREIENLEMLLVKLVRDARNSATSSEVMWTAEMGVFQDSILQTLDGILQRTPDGATIERIKQVFRDNQPGLPQLLLHAAQLKFDRWNTDLN